MSDTRIGTARRLGDVVRTTDKPPKRFEPGRRCESCRAKLATDNPDPRCSPCQKTARSW